jgi:hypothetical protein
MNTFEQWLTENHPEILDENWRDILRNGTRAGTTAAGIFAGGFFPPHNVALGAENRPAAVQSAGKTVTIQRQYEFDDNEDIRDAVNDAVLELKAKIAKTYGQQLSGIDKPQVQIDRKNRIVTVTINVPENLSVQSRVPAKSTPSVQKRVSRSDF